MPHPGPSLCGVLMAADSNVCANFQEFLSTLRPPKVPGRLKKKIKKKKIIILWKTIGPCALLAWALIIILWKTIGPCALLAWALTSALLVLFSKCVSVNAAIRTLVCTKQESAALNLRVSVHFQISSVVDQLIYVKAKWTKDI